MSSAETRFLINCYLGWLSHTDSCELRCRGRGGGYKDYISTIFFIQWEMKAVAIRFLKPLLATVILPLVPVMLLHGNFRFEKHFRTYASKLLKKVLYINLNLYIVIFQTNYDGEMSFLSLKVLNQFYQYVPYILLWILCSSWLHTVNSNLLYTVCVMCMNGHYGILS